jgi:hypothetical protein
LAKLERLVSEKQSSLSCRSFSDEGKRELFMIRKPAVNVIKVSFVVTDGQKSRLFDPDKPVHPSLIYEDKAGAFPSGETLPVLPYSVGFFPYLKILDQAGKA